MDIDKQSRLQRFLSIIDTIHDFCNTNRNITNSKDKLTRELLKDRVLQSLNLQFSYALEAERIFIDNAQLHDQMLIIQREIYCTADGPNLPNNLEEKTITIIKDIFKAHNKDYYNEGEYFKILSIPKNMSSEELNNKLKDICGCNYVKYVLDKNRAKSHLFCVNPFNIKIINTTQSNPLYKKVIQRSIYKGLFYDFENQKNKISIKTGTHSVLNYFTTNTQNNTISGKEDCLHLDIVDYSLEKTSNELFTFDKLGVKKFNNKFRLYHTIGNLVDSPILFENNKKTDFKGLTLFLKSLQNIVKKFNKDKEFYKDDITNIEQLETNALETISDVFRIRYKEFTYKTPMNKDKIIYLPKLDFMYAIYDLKRSMDYLPVKACRNINKQFEKDSIKYFYITSDRLALMYALIQECPCIYIEYNSTNDNIINNFHIYNYKSNITGGALHDNTLIHKVTLFKEDCNITIEQKKQKEYNEKIPLTDILDFNNPIDSFEQFLIGYKELSGRNYITYFWYVVYRFMFFFME
jgi:hypothetical protein